MDAFNLTSGANPAQRGANSQYQGATGYRSYNMGGPGGANLGGGPNFGGNNLTPQYMANPASVT